MKIKDLKSIPLDRQGRAVHIYNSNNKKGKTKTIQLALLDRREERSTYPPQTEESGKTSPQRENKCYTRAKSIMDDAGSNMKHVVS